MINMVREGYFLEKRQTMLHEHGGSRVIHWVCVFLLSALGGGVYPQEQATTCRETKRTLVFYSGSKTSGIVNGAGPITSGLGTNGSPDPITRVDEVDGRSAVIIEKNSGWVVISNTQWISYADTSSQGPTNNTFIMFFVRFFIPEDAKNPTLAVDALGDDNVKVFLNGSQLPGETNQTKILTFTANQSTLFSTGSQPNVLRLQVTQLAGDGFGLNYRAIVTYGFCTFTRGDANKDGKLDISDSINTLNVLFVGKGAILCADAADSNDDGRIDISDVIYTIAFLFTGGPIPPEPFSSCGLDPTADDLRECNC